MSLFGHNMSRLERLEVTKNLRLTRDLRPPHRHHATAARIGMLRYESCSGNRNICFDEASKALKEVVSCLENILPFPTKDLAAVYSALGDMLHKSYAMSGNVDPSLVIQAHEAYMSALRLFNALYGTSHPRCIAVDKALQYVKHQDN